MPAAAMLIVLMMLGAGTAPDEHRAHPQHDNDRKKLRPSHAGNIAANRRGANGIFDSILRFDWSGAQDRRYHQTLNFEPGTLNRKLPHG